MGRARQGPEPVDVVSALRGPGPLAFLDGGLDPDGLGRWSYVGVDPVGAVFAWGSRILHLAGRERAWERGDPFRALERRVGELGTGEPGSRPAGETAPSFRRGAVGWLGYELGWLVEPGAAPRPGPAASLPGLLPDMAFWLYADVLAHDNRAGRWWGGGERARRALAGAVATDRPAPPARTSLQADFAPRDYAAAVQRIREHILAGDVYQVNLSQRFRGHLAEDPYALYRRLRARRPAPLGAYLEAGHRAVLSNSPELFLRRTGARVETRPIKGTRPRGATPEADAALAAQLLESDKDAAELTMIVDLMRNDLGKLARAGSVRVPSRKRLVSLPTVHHLVATVEADLELGVGLAELLRATFPAGSITGCPKGSAMQLINRLEPCRRGVYTGAIGWIGSDGDLMLSVAIRTLSVARGRLSLHAGGGVVVDSRPDDEYQETLAKARAFFEALGAE